jgi:hypothetical protein
MLMAPVAFCTIGAFTSGVLDARAPRALGVLWLLNALSVLLTGCGAWQRRRALLASMRPLTPGWVALTFPLTSNANAALRFWIASAGAPPWASALAGAYAALLLVATAALVPCVTLAWLLNLPRWLLWDAPTRPASMSIHVPTEGSARAAAVRMSHVSCRISLAHSLGCNHDAAESELSEESL